jgi:speckle-type POZ protein
MTTGFAILKSILWPLKKKRSVGERRVSQKNERKISKENERRSSRRQSVDKDGNLEIVAPRASNVEFKYNWSVGAFVKQVKTCKENGLRSKPFTINMNGICTEWSLSLQFWVDGQGCRLTNPVVLCLNMVACKVDTKQDVDVRFQFGLFNQNSQEYEMGQADKASIMVEEKDKLQSVGYKNIAISEKHVSSSGEVILSVKLSLSNKEEVPHSLSSDLSTLFHSSVPSADCVVSAGDREWAVHRNILSARSPVFADQLAEEGARLVIPSLSPDTVQSLLLYLYTDRLECEGAGELLAAATQYCVPGLHRLCEEYLLQTLSPHTVAELLLLAEQNQATTLKTVALQYCRDHHSYIMKDSCWARMEEQSPALFSEAISCVATVGLCEQHQECLERGGRYRDRQDTSILRKFSK